VGGPVLVAKPLPEFRPGGGDTDDVPSRFGRLLGEPESGQRRYDDIERVVDMSPERHRVSQRANEFQELDDRTGPSVRRDQGHRVRILGLDVDEMNIQPVDHGQELGETIEF
jgi:hypothetical protein